MATVTKRGDTYRIRVSCGYDAKGKQVTRSTTWKPAPGMTERQAEKELQRQIVLFEEQCSGQGWAGEAVAAALQLGAGQRRSGSA